ncbi:hypothetical protein [Aeromonas hydrophila]|uniref:hypothetical protein n=1 Tax=Aeromonas hydrophila TaxID=644 RepID=UPI001C5BF6F3|nr:hypothetical protein [Aeromonas hydrophila]MBW3834625.1 hypothetical protein [Aeromonas hydrophila]MBW5266925.1 hypothetical protein [Aeromonas hydrophila]MBW5278105.1 hypothetical protein [Aeromonas hydrophila]
MIKKKVTISLSKIILCIYILMALLLATLYSFDIITSAKWAPLVGGGLVSIVALLVQFITDYLDYVRNEKIINSGLVGVLERRDDKDFYRKIIKNSKAELKFIFHTGKRFTEDFCQAESGDNEFILALTRGVNVKLLLPEADSIKNEDEKQNLISSLDRFIEIKRKFEDNFEIRLYNHEPHHSIFASDTDVIVGPYFEKRKSKYSQSLHFKTGAAFTLDYIQYFDEEWSGAKSQD